MKRMGRFIAVFAMLSIAANAYAGAGIGFFSEIGKADESVNEVISWCRTHGYDTSAINLWDGGLFKREGGDRTIILKDYSLLWLDAGGELNVAKELVPLPKLWSSELCKKALLEYVCDGGVLVVSTVALRYPYDMGIEPVAPDDWGQISGQNESAIKTLLGNEITGDAGALLKTCSNVSRTFRWVRYRTAMPKAGDVLATEAATGTTAEIIRWNIGKGKIYGFSMLPWHGEQNAGRETCEKILTSLFKAAGMSPDDKIIKKVAAEKQAASELHLKEDLRLTGIGQEAGTADKNKKPLYAELLSDGFIIGNACLERRIQFTPEFCTSYIFNKLSDETISVGSAEFRITLGKTQQEYNFSSADFKLTGKPKIIEDTNKISVECLFERSASPRLAVKLTYTADGSPNIAKRFEILNTGASEVFLREVWLDTLRFNDSIEVIPYTVLSGFARSKAGSLWICQDLPYSIASGSSEDKWMAIAYPPCQPLGMGSSYVSERSYLTAVRLSGTITGPFREWQQITGYGTFPQPNVGLDEAEINSCTDWVDRHGLQIRQAHIWFTSACDYGFFKAWSDALPSAQIPPEKWDFEAFKKFADFYKSYGFEDYQLCPFLASKLKQKEAFDKVMTEQVVPYLKSVQMGYIETFTTYGKDFWAGVGLLGDKVLQSFGDTALQDELLELLVDQEKRYNYTAIFQDQGNFRIDVAYDQSFGFPGKHPLSPWLYREYKAWQRIHNELRSRTRPDLRTGFGHFGNNQAPLFFGIITQTVFSEPSHGIIQFRRLKNRLPAVTGLKEQADTYRRECYWMHKGRFTPYRFMDGWLYFQRWNFTVYKPDGEPAHQLARYMLLQNIATRPLVTAFGLRTLDATGFFDENDRKFYHKWLAFAKEHSKELCSGPFIPYGEPRYGNVEVYSYGDRAEGLVFIVNPSYFTMGTTVRVDKEFGFNTRGTYAVKELTPYERWHLMNGVPAIEYGDGFEVKVPGYTVMVLQILPVDKAWNGLKKITAGAEITGQGRVIAFSGEQIECGVFDVTNPRTPQKISFVKGVVAGTSPRIEIGRWRVVEDTSQGKQEPDFAEAQTLLLEDTNSVSQKFDLSDFAGALILDMQKDPVVDRGEISFSELKTLENICDTNAVRIDRFKGRGDAYWLEADFSLDYIPQQTQIVLQSVQPERVKFRVWINGVEQVCTKRTLEGHYENTKNAEDAYNWFIPKVSGLKIGVNRFRVWIGG